MLEKIVLFLGKLLGFLLCALIVYGGVHFAIALVGKLMLSPAIRVQTVSELALDVFGLMFLIALVAGMAIASICSVVGCFIFLGSMLFEKSRK